MSQLKADLRNAFQAADERIKLHRPGAGDLLAVVRRLLQAPMRFIEPNRSIQDAQAALRAAILTFQEARQPTNATEERHRRQARQAASEALIKLQRAVFEHGCASAAADRVGLGVQGTRIKD